LAGATVGSVLLAGVVLGRLVSRFEVAGPSMLPELAPGERLIVVRLPGLEVGDLVAVRDPALRERILVKRVSAVAAGTVEVRGDNSGASRDSRSFGPVARRDVLGRVVLRYHPAEDWTVFRRRSPGPEGWQGPEGWPGPEGSSGLTGSGVDTMSPNHTG
jgi:nickel-type superoxide dismutase maturation protease